MKTLLRLEMDNDEKKYEVKNRIDLMKHSMIDLNMVRSYSLRGLLEKEYGIDIADKISDKFGYHGDTDEQNAFEGIKMLLRDVDTRFCSFKNGYGELINILYQYNMQHGVKISLNTKYVNLYKSNESYICETLINDTTQYQINDQISNHMFPDHVIFAIPKHSLQKSIKFWKRTTHVWKFNNGRLVP